MKAMKSILILLMIIMLSGLVHALPVSIQDVQLDDVELTQGATTRLDVVRGNTVDVEVRFTAAQDLKDVELEAFLSGFEYSDVDPARGSIGPFDVDANVSYVKHFTIRLNSEFQEDDYKLRLLFTDRNNDISVFNYDLKVDVNARHSLMVQDVVLSPGSTIEAGRALLATVRVDNKGEKTEKDVKVTASIPELGVSASDYISQIKYDDEEETEEMYLSIPRCAEEGTYDMDVVLTYDEGFESVKETMRVRVVGSDSCSLAAAADKDGSAMKPAQEPAVATQGSGVQVNVVNRVVDVPQPEPVDQESKGGVRSVLEVILIILLVVLIIVGIVVGVSKLRQDSEDDEEEF